MTQAGSNISRGACEWKIEPTGLAPSRRGMESAHMWWHTRLATGCAVVALSCLAGLTGAAQGAELKPRPIPAKPAAFKLSSHDSREVLVVKFREGLDVRLGDAGVPLIDGREVAGLRAPAGARGAQWMKAYRQDRAKLLRLRDTAQANLGREIGDPNLNYRLHLPAGSDAGAMVDALNALDVVELAWPSQLPTPAPLPPSFQPQQIYIEAAPPGIGSVPCWDEQGITGQGVRVGDIEYDWLLTHLDLPPVINSGLTPALTEATNKHHGLAVLGMIGSKPNGWGTTGMAPDAELHISTSWSVESQDGIDIAIYELLDVFEAGDVIQLEAQTWDDLGSGILFYPVEIYWWNREAIMTAVGNGIVVVEAAANGGAFLDPTLEVFHPQFDSGALIVGAGSPSPPYSAQGGGWLSFSNYGPTVDLQGWGSAVRTTGYGQLWSSEGVNLFYTNTFGGTSSATPMVSAAVALLQSAAKEVRGAPLTPAEVRTALRATGTLQPSSTPGQQSDHNIGSRPDVHAAILSLFDCDENGFIDSRDIERDPALDCNRNGVLDSCELGPLSLASNELFPLGAGFPQTFTIGPAPAAGGDVTLQFLAVGDLGFSSENVSVTLNGAPLGTIYQSGAHDCPQVPDQATIVVPAKDWNAAVAAGVAGGAGGSIAIVMTSSAGVDPILCPGGSWIKVAATFMPAVSPDADGDGVLDACRKKAIPGDLNGDGHVNGLDLAMLLASWTGPASYAPCPPFAPADLSADCRVNGLDIAMLLAAWAP